MDRLTKLFLGATVPTGGIVTRRALDNFLSGAVTPEFPGFTVQDATGSWEGETEPAWILTIVHNSKQQTLIDVHRIGLAYKATFRQGAVLIVSTVVDSVLV